MSSYDYLSSNGIIPLGNLLAGLASAAYGIHETLVGMTVVGLLVALAVAVTPAVWQLPRGVPTPATADPPPE